MSYNLDLLAEKGAPVAFAMLMRCIRDGEPFVTYSEIKDEIQRQLGIRSIFTVHIGHVAGRLMDEILAVDERAPLINVLITQASGIPGTGAGAYLAERYGLPKLKKWGKISRERRLDIVQEEREKIFAYKKWLTVGRRAFGKLLPLQSEGQNNVESSGYGGSAESEEHKRLKFWVSKHPGEIGVAAAFGAGKTEVLLASGDEVDVVFSAGTSFRVVEVKSVRSNEEDLKRGIYQCVKYREVKRAEHAPYKIDVQSILVTERKLPPVLAEKARILCITVKTVAVNKLRPRVSR